jgi:isopenicillin N synthase-like dioxygenase
VQPPTTEQDPSPPILVNTGDLLALWTDNLLRSTVHRVVFPVEDVADRYSIAYFAHPVGTTVLEAVPSAKVREKAKEKEAEGESVQEREARRAMTADEYLFSRLKATYLGLYGNGKTEGKAVTA